MASKDSETKKNKSLKQEVRNRIATYVTTAIGLVAGLAWNDAIKEIIENLFPLAQDTIMAKLLYALIITIVLAAVSVYLVRFFSEDNKK